MLTYQTYIFDCDGVLLDSNQLKAKAFYEVAQPYGEEVALALEAYHQQHGGVSRYKKFEYFFKTLLRLSDADPQIQEAITRFSQISLEKLLQCPETEGMQEFLEKRPAQSKSYVISGGAQTEVQAVFQQRHLEHYFESIYGSPEDKITLLQRLKNQGQLIAPYVFIGDSITDYEAAQAFGLDFVFMWQYTILPDWQAYFRGKSVRLIQNLKYW